MKKILTLSVVFFLGMLYTAEAQTVVARDDIYHPANLHDEPVLKDENANAHMIWAPVGFKKERVGAPTYKQIFVLEGKAKFTFEGEAKEVSRGSWVVIPANTAHTVEVVGEDVLKMLAVQKK